MSKSKLMRLVVLASGTLLALGGCASSSWVPWLIGAGVLRTLLNQPSA